MNTALIASLEDLTRPGGALDLGPSRARLMVRMLRLLAEGKPLGGHQVDAAITDLGIPPDEAHAQLDAWTERTDDGDIVGLGFTYNPTPHRVTVGDANMWAWCAMDTLIFAIVLDRPLLVESTPPRTGEVVRLQASPAGVSGLQPTNAVITWPRRESGQVDISTTSSIWGSFCHHSFLFPTRETAKRWAADRDDIEILSLDDGFEVAQAVASALLRYEQAQGWPAMTARAVHNHPEPFVWIATAEPVLARVRRGRVELSARVADREGAGDDAGEAARRRVVQERATD